MRQADTSQRIASIDIFRAFTMLMMLWVNDFAGMAGVPHALEHAETMEDMMGFSDLVFPAFLFCVGLSIPFAIGSRERKGDSPLQVILHILTRSLALIVMGIFSMNLGGVKGGLPGYALTLMAIAAYFLIWNVYPKKQEGSRKHLIFKAMQILGVAILAFILIYKDIHGASFSVGWWGILGLIGWAYAISSLAYLFTKGSFCRVLTAWIIFLALPVLNQLPFIPNDYSLKWMFLSFYPGGWTHPGLVMSGVMASAAMVRFADRDNSRPFVLNMLAAGLLMAVCGVVSHNFWIVSKNLATPTWMFECLALFFAIFGLLFWLCDAKGKTRWANVIKPAGSATLTAYVLPSVWYALMSLTGFSYPAAISHGLPGLVRSMCFAFIIIGLTWCLGKVHIKLKL